jgi:hypothetical protein
VLVLVEGVGIALYDEMQFVYHVRDLQARQRTQRHTLEQHLERYLMLRPLPLGPRRPGGTTNDVDPDGIEGRYRTHPLALRYIPEKV